MGPRIGLIAGSGDFPLLALDEAAKRGWTCVVAGVRGQALHESAEKAEAFLWFEPGRPEEAVRFFKERGVEQVLLAGKVDPRAYFHRESVRAEGGDWLRAAEDGTATGLLQAFLRFLAEKGLQVMDPGPFLAPFFCAEGTFTRVQPTAEILRDSEFGRKIARNLADLDIGQTIVVKDRAVVAVEAAEGTDAVIRRAAGLAGPGTVIIKVSRTRQDLRVDVPAVGRHTVQAMIDAGASALCIEAERVAFFQRPESVELADREGVILFARRM